ncbi:hypothetical protein [Paraburkholderia susongensis]|uniref:Uncharacterized protein n=1 Tax=Paraburkholderia susongensis TaxID=1515439 RepID=A0A1X7LC24_9BURK|nr:hypothetical protein [Paraburkholderia susongensis]SMG51408.1 hypothetical protein SAMN06265784_105433 [Paraburkholderia susongensis]
MSKQRTPSSIVVHYDTEQKMLVCNAVAEAAVRPLCEGKLDIPVLLEEFDFKLDDEFARRFGAAILSLLAEYKPELKQFVSVTPAQ